MISISNMVRVTGLCLALVLAGSVQAQDDGQGLTDEDFDARVFEIFGDNEGFRLAFDAVTEAVRQEDVPTVASFIKYPFRTEVDGEDHIITDEAEFETWYPSIFTPEVASVVADQNYAELFANNDGVMFGDGEMWMLPICLDDQCSSFYWTIGAINQPE